MRRRTGAVLGGVLLAGAAALSAPGGAPPASASCAGPTLAVEDAPGSRGAVPEVEAGGTLVVDGSYFVDGCDDTGSQAGGCSAPEVTERPLTDVTLTLSRADRVVDLGARDAGTAAEQQLGDVRWEATLPTDLAPGRAVLATDAVEGGRLVVRVVTPPG
ncbi:hypothetical protein [Nocardioides sp. AX2bis]|uniref:hypothetical protein n=1 Tax=Nocardioides sp. AX2bis TaxID=2653157 RepID=UPI0012F1A762|nr:hypothetical protein [Nocardioides sp. AX2bis]VXC23595.1 conserved exported hypothetical protein [Nocardioides sp. AX2bis]